MISAFAGIESRSFVHAVRSLHMHVFPNFFFLEVSLQAAF
jgi:hypothetical protein